MLSFGLKIAWFVLSLTGVICCWIVLWAFGRALGAKWAVMVYSVGNTILQGTFCLGMIYEMDPFKMPKSFCIAQVIIIAFGSFLISGVALSFSLATSMVVLKPKTWGDGPRALRWRAVYSGPLIAFPIVTSTIHIILVRKFDTIQPSDDMHCDSTSPEWFRFFGYAGVPVLLAGPSLFLSIKSIMRVYKTNRHIERSRTDSVDGFGAASLPRKKREVQFTRRMKREPVSSSKYIASPALAARNFHLPHPSTNASLTQTAMSGKGDSSSNLSVQLAAIDDSSSNVSVTLPTFADPDRSVVVSTDDQHGPNSHELADVVGVALGNGDAQTNENGKIVARPSIGRRSDNKNGDKFELQMESAKDEYIMTEPDPNFSRSMTSRMVSLGVLPQRNSRRPLPNLAPAVWRIILFQVAFISVQILASISTVIDVSTHRPTPTPLGTQHFALLLTAWCPVFVFGHLPAVRRNVVPWLPVS